MQTVSSSRCYKHSAATNWNDLPYDIRDCSSVSVLSVNLKVIFLALSILPSRVSPQRLRITFLLHMALYKFFYIVLYCKDFATNLLQSPKATEFLPRGQYRISTDEFRYSSINCEDRQQRR